MALPLGGVLLVAGGPARAQTPLDPSRAVSPTPANVYYTATTWRQRPASAQDIPSFHGTAWNGASSGAITDEDGTPILPLRVPLLGRAAAPEDSEDNVPTFRIQLPASALGTAAPGSSADQALAEFQLVLTTPGPLQLFRLESEANLRERIRQQTPIRPFEVTTLPAEDPLSKEKESPQRAWGPQREFAFPNYLCYGPLLVHQQLNLERYGWDLGAIQSFVSLGDFWYDVLLGPYHVAVGPWCPWQRCSAGYCLPGDPVPLRLYPPQWPISVTITHDEAKDCEPPTPSPSPTKGGGE